MRKLTMLTAVLGAIGLAVVAPAGAVRDRTPPQLDPITGTVVTPRFTLRAAGTVRSFGTSGTMQQFRVDLHAGPGHKLTLVDPASGIAFRSLLLGTVMFAPHTAKLTGIGMVDGRRVHFTAIAVSHPQGADVFKLDWDGKASYGGPLQSGGVRITEIAV